MKVVMLALVLLVNLFFGATTLNAANTDKVIVYMINGEIDDSSLAMVKKVYVESVKADAKLIVMQMDTFGGMVDSATKMRDIIIDSKIPTVCLVKNRAWSAGALLALAHNKIAMTNSASIGAAEPIPATEKTISALKAEFSSTAEKTGRNQKIAEAMVDKTLGYKNYAKPGQILSLTQEQAKQEGIADLAAQDVDEVISKMGIVNPEKIYVEKTFKESLIGWLNNPAVKSILMTIIMLGIITEIKSAGTGIAGLIAVLAGVAIFGGGLIMDSGAYLPLLVFLLGLGLLILEIFIPGFGISGIAGVICVIASFFLTLGGGVAAIKWIALSVLLTVAGIYLLGRFLPQSSIYNRIVLKTNSEVIHNVEDTNNALVGQQGITITLMRPAGKIKINDIIFDALTFGDFLAAGERIKVDKVVGDKIYIKKV